MRQIHNIIIFITGIAVLIAVAIRQHNNEQLAKNVTLATEDSLIINTTESGKDFHGYAGKVPLEIHISNGIITQVIALPNSETPDFFNHASAILNSWDGLTIAEAKALKVDAVSGATYSSRAIINNVKAGLEEAEAYTGTPPSNPTPEINVTTAPDSIANWAALAVLLMAMTLPLFLRNRWYRNAQLVLNIAVLGLWSCTFINYRLLVSAVSNGLDPLTSYLPTLMLIAAFVYPLFGKKNYYCNNICPLGSAQELTAKIPVRKLTVNRRVADILTWFREILWAALMILMAFGIWADWMNYEPFSAFAFTAASAGIIIFAITILIISIFVPRAYCRFACPTGTLLKSVPSFKKLHK